MSLQKPNYDDEVAYNTNDWLEQYPWKQEKSIRTESDRYEISIDLKEFSPKEIAVKIIDGFIIVEAEHEEKKDEYGYVSRHFKRWYNLPDEYASEKVVSKLSADGVLSIIAPREVAVKMDTAIPVEHEGWLKCKL